MSELTSINYASYKNKTTLKKLTRKSVFYYLENIKVLKKYLIFETNKRKFKIELLETTFVI